MTMITRMAVWALCLALPVPGMALEDGKFAVFGDVKIHYIERGKGEPVVLLHGGSSNLQSWIVPGVVDALAKDFRVIAFDARGQGKSSSPHDPLQYGRQQALDVPRLLDTLKIERAHIVGFSLGGSTVAQLLTLHPERFLTATQLAGAGRSPQAANDPRIEVEASEIAKSCISRSRLFRQAPPNEKPAEQQYLEAMAKCRADKSFDQLAVAASLRGYKDQAVTPEQMQALKVPTLGIVGTMDHTLKEMQTLKSLRPDMKLIVVDSLSHMGATGMQQWAGLPTAIREFILAHRK